MNTEDEIFHVYDRMDRLFMKGEFDKVDQIIKMLNPSVMDVHIIIAYIISSNWRKDELPSRPEFVKKCRSELELKIGVEKTEEAMKNLG